MIKPIRAWLDSAGAVHNTREDACKAEFRELLRAHFKPAIESSASDNTDDCLVIGFEQLVEGMFDIDKMIGAATREDSRAGIVTDYVG